jgi:hypothetical protein
MKNMSELSHGNVNRNSQFTNSILFMMDFQETHYGNCLFLSRPCSGRLNTRSNRTIEPEYIHCIMRRELQNRCQYVKGKIHPPTLYITARPKSCNCTITLKVVLSIVISIKAQRNINNWSSISTKRTKAKILQ